MAPLQRPLRRFVQESAWLEIEFSMGASMGTTAGRLACEMAVVRLHDSWSRCCRDLIVCSACGTTTLSGTAVPASPLVIGGQGAVVPALLGTFKNRKTEPKWFDSAECIDAAQRLGLTNLTTIAGGLGATTSPSNVVRAVRNYYAHRGMYTAQQVAQHGLFSKAQMPDVFELHRPVRPGMSYFSAWVHDFTDTLRAASQ